MPLACVLRTLDMCICKNSPQSSLLSKPNTFSVTFYLMFPQVPATCANHCDHFDLFAPIFVHIIDMMRHFDVGFILSTFQSQSVYRFNHRKIGPLSNQPMSNRPPGKNALVKSDSRKKCPSQIGLQEKMP